MAQHLQYRVGDDDAQKYGDQWWTLDLDALTKMPASKLVDLEAAMGGFSIQQLISGMRVGSAMSRWAAVWIARRQAGIDEEFGEGGFDPAPFFIRSRTVNDDDQVVDEALEDAADPPSSGPSTDA